jgi:hypothetical protein
MVYDGFKSVLKKKIKPGEIEEGHIKPQDC